MIPRRNIHRLGAALVAGALLLAACGDSGDEPTPTSTAPTTLGATVTSGVVGEEPVPTGDEPEPVVAGGVLAGGGLTVSEALTTDATGVLAVRGFIVDDGTARLCEALAESFPPQCGGAGVPIEGYRQVDVGELTQSGGVTWTDFEVVVFGELVDGTLVVAPNVTG